MKYAIGAIILFIIGMAVALSVPFGFVEFQDKVQRVLIGISLIIFGCFIASYGIWVFRYKTFKLIFD